MPRRKDLKDISYGIVTSFISRNNDLAGYWGIGKLCLAANQNDSSFVKLDILNSLASLNTNEFDAMINHYREMLQRLLSKRSIPTSWVTKATLVTSFNQANDKRYHFFQSAVGQPFICKITITDDLGKEHSITTGGYCKPHDPSKESRRAPMKRIL